METTDPQPGQARDSAALLPLYRVMRRIRAFENAAEIASQGGVAAWGLAEKTGQPAHVRGPLHLSTGQEAVAAGVCAALRIDDLLTSTHRGHGHTLAKGADVRRMMAELFGKAGGCNGGKGGSMHIADFSIGMLGANGVVAAGLAIAVGAAQGLRLQAGGGLSARIVCCFFGDGATNRGPFLESLNWAAVFGCPVLFVCEDNRISATTPTASMSAGAGIAGRAAALGVPGVAVDGNDVLAVAAAAREQVALIRADNEPRLLHAVTYRFKGHVSVDPGTYRDADEVAQALAADPVLRTRERLFSLGAPAAELDALDAAVDAEIAAAVAFAEADAAPDASTAFTDVLDAGPQWH